MSPRAPAHRHQPVFQSLFAAAVLAGLLAYGPAAADTTPALQQQARHYDIPSQPLSAALIDFGQQANMQVSADSRLLGDKYSGAVQGMLTLEPALQRLLGGTGLIWHLSPNGALNLEPEPSRAALSQRPMQFDDVVVLAEQQRKQGNTVIDRRTIEALPAGNGDITSLLKTHPNVQFDNSQLSSKTPGEIGPANISINGAKFYQNAFLVDGMNMNNDINPGDTVSTNDASKVPGRSQGLALDTDLLDNIKVLDSNVPAAYGGFNGGVVEANTRRPTQDFHGKVSYQTTRSDWTRYHIDEDQQEYFDGASMGELYGYQPEFEKHVVRSTLEGHLTENFGLLANFSQKTSSIPVSIYSPNNLEKAGYASDKQDRELKSQNFFIKGVWKANERLDVEGSLAHAPESATHFRDNALNTRYSIESGGTLINLKSVYQGDLARYTQQVGLSLMENSRDSDADDWNNWRKSSVKNWGITSAMEGGYGDIEQSQRTIGYKLNVAWDAIALYGMVHRLSSGVELRHQQFEYERLTATDVSTYLALPASGNCALASSLDGSGRCDSDARQYVRTLTQFSPGTFDFSLDQLALYLQDEIEIGRLSLRPGVRLEKDSYMDVATLAPRLELEWDVFGDRGTRISAGRNRYYGRNAAQWLLEEGHRQLRSDYARTNYTADWTQSGYLTDAPFNQLDIPYDDELTFGITQKVRDLELGLKWVRREGRDQVRRDKLKNNSDPSMPADYYRYTNNGRSNTEVVTLTLTPLHSFDFWGTRHAGQFAADWQHHNTNVATYTDDFTDLDNDYVRYQGAIIHESELPPTNFSHDWTYRLSTFSELPMLNLKWSNFFRYRSDLQTLKRTYYKVDGYNEVYDKRYPAAFTWDMRLGWELPTGKDQAAFVNLDIFNLTDRVNVSGNTSQTTAMTSAVYETGRQYWVEVGYRF